MIKILALFVCLLPSLSLASGGFMTGSGAEAGAVTFCDTCDYDFEGASWPTDWSGDADHDGDSTGLSMCNSQVVEMDAGEGASFNFSTGEDAVYMAFYWRYANGFDENNERVWTFDDGGVPDHRVLVDADETMECRMNSGSTVGGSTTLVPGTTYLIKTYAQRNTGGNNGTITVWISDGSAWQQECTSTNGTDSGSLQNFNIDNLQDGTGVEYQYFDCVVYSTSDIGHP